MGNCHLIVKTISTLKWHFEYFVSYNCNMINSDYLNDSLIAQTDDIVWVFPSILLLMIVFFSDIVE